MIYLVITLLFATAFTKRSGGSSAQSSTYIEYDTDWYYDPVLQALIQAIPLTMTTAHRMITPTNLETKDQEKMYLWKTS